MKLWKPAIVVAAVFAALTIPSHFAQTTRPKISDEDLFPDKVLAKGKGFEVKQSELDNAFISYKASLAARGTALPEARREKAEADLLDQLIFEKILLKRANAADKAAAQKEADKAYDEVATKIPENIFAQKLRAAGMDLATFKERMVAEATRREVLDRELKAEIKIPDADVKKFYDDNLERFKIPEQVRASHILISTVNKTTGKPLPEAERAEKEKKIKEILAKVKKGEDFAKLAKEYSEDPGSRDNGGEYTFPRGEMTKPFENTAFALKPGEVSDIVESPFGFHIIKQSEKIAGRQRTFDEVKDDIRKLLTAREFEKQLPAFFEKLKKESDVQVMTSK